MEEKGNVHLKLTFKTRIHRSAYYIFISFGIIDPILVTLKIENRLSWCWGGGGGEGGGGRGGGW